ncbi:MAG: RraA family protein [Tindallia sp. MSAO_Bac2]|nr:MAG: RraA family protein [Tindallia sp. MSAO_Bac2]
MIAEFSKLDVTTIYEAVGEKYILDPFIKPIASDMRFCGRAFTVRNKMSDSFPILKALEMAKPGEVIVADAGDSIFSTVWGGSSSRVAKMKNLAGFLTNGAVRDYREIVNIGLPVFSRGLYAKGTKKQFFGEYKIPLQIAGVEVLNGDIIIGDIDGVVVVPQKREKELLTKAQQQMQKENEILNRINQGESLLEILGL